MSFDETYDEMLHDEFSSRGKHQAKAAAAEPEPTGGASRGRHAAAEEAETQTGAAERPRGLQRYRTAGLVGAGGLACAAAGAFLGGLGGYFTISPAAAHPVAAPTITQDLPLAQAVNHGAHSSSGARGTSAVTAAEFSKVFGSLTKGIGPFASLTSDPFGNLAVNGLPGVGGSGSGKGGRGARQRHEGRRSRWRWRRADRLRVGLERPRPQLHPVGPDRRADQPRLAHRRQPGHHGRAASCPPSPAW